MWASSTGRRRGVVAGGLVALCAAAGFASGSMSAAAAAQDGHMRPHVLAVFRNNAKFAESLAQGPRGALFASVTTWGSKANRGRIFRITRDGGKSAFGPVLRTGPGVLTGVAFDAAGALYVADATFATTPAPGVFRVTASGATRVLTLPANTFPNGLVFHHGSLYISDSNHGAIWRWTPRTQPAPASLTRPWFRGSRLATGGAVSGIGPNGLAVRHERLYVAVSDAKVRHTSEPVGRIAFVPIHAGGAHGALHVVRTSRRLATVDGIAFARSGALWMVTNGHQPKKGGPLTGQRLLRLGPRGDMEVVAHDARWMNYPTALVINRRPGRRALFVENGAFLGGRANVLRLR